MAKMLLWGRKFQEDERGQQCLLQPAWFTQAEGRRREVKLIARIQRIHNNMLRKRQRTKPLPV